MIKSFLLNLTGIVWFISYAVIMHEYHSLEFDYWRLIDRIKHYDLDIEYHDTKEGAKSIKFFVILSSLMVVALFLLIRGI